MTHQIFVTRDVRGLGHPHTARLVKTAISAVLATENVTCPCRVDVLLTDDAGIHEINLSQRGVDRATDVLSFPANYLTAGEFLEEACEYDPETKTIFLGDMAISVPRCQAQGEEYGHGYEREVSYLAVHSTLHLLGYDHMDEGEEKKHMRSREKLIMETLGITR